VTLLGELFTADVNQKLLDEQASKASCLARRGEVRIGELRVNLLTLTEYFDATCAVQPEHLK